MGLQGLTLRIQFGKPGDGVGVLTGNGLALRGDVGSALVSALGIAQGGQLRFYARRVVRRVAQGGDSLCAFRDGLLLGLNLGGQVGGFCRTGQRGEVRFQLADDALGGLTRGFGFGYLTLHRVHRRL
ncbi:MAG: hypothetical protein BWY76_02567 [bacterium ADurb.Bin429]|nr:MAG: hypothetical protein BWY76_02567 [bacterium ADurb.Bin429]